MIHRYLHIDHRVWQTPRFLDAFGFRFLLPFELEFCGRLILPHWSSPPLCSGNVESWMSTYVISQKKMSRNSRRLNSVSTNGCRASMPSGKFTSPSKRIAVGANKIVGRKSINWKNSNPDRTLEKTLLHQVCKNLTLVPPTGTGNHCSNWPAAVQAQPFRLDRSNGANQGLTGNSIISSTIFASLLLLLTDTSPAFFHPNQCLDRQTMPITFLSLGLVFHCNRFWYIDDFSR